MRSSLLLLRLQMKCLTCTLLPSNMNFLLNSSQKELVALVYSRLDLSNFLGMQACITLKKLIESGVYHWNIENQKVTMCLEFSNSGAGVRMYLEDLIDLRNRLMLAEISAQKDTEMIPQLMQLFIEQLRLVVEMNKTFKLLHDSGHFDFHKHQESVIFNLVNFLLIL